MTYSLTVTRRNGAVMRYAYRAFDEAKFAANIEIRRHGAISAEVAERETAIVQTTYRKSDGSIVKSDRVYDVRDASEIAQDLRTHPKVIWSEVV